MVEIRIDRASPTPDLLAAYASILAELRRRGVVRTGNAPAGDYAEWLVHQALGGTLEPNSTKSHDITTDSGVRVQVKSRVVSDPIEPGERQLSVIRSWDFDQLAIVLLDRDDYRVRRAVLLPTAVARESARWIAHVNGDRVMATPTLLDHPDRTDLSLPTDEL